MGSFLVTFVGPTFLVASVALIVRIVPSLDDVSLTDATRRYNESDPRNINNDGRTGRLQVNRGQTSPACKPRQRRTGGHLVPQTASATTEYGSASSGVPDV